MREIELILIVMVQNGPSQLHKVVKLEKTVIGDKQKELFVTLELMRKYGIDNVRGASYVKVNFTQEDRKQINQLICHQYDLCQGCGQGNHFIKECPYRIQYNRQINQLTVQSNQINNIQQPVINDQQNDSCYICHKVGHYSKQCPQGRSNNDTICQKCKGKGHYLTQ
ncbi:Conserved_hypothetical protein [Hexamita inflata]|uniref:CCHC-type domain-containing protein n=1 Tax=Hexamita inflata TaxID=28002 RepID=A0AA86TLW8_9EUKA|nr:Conserved hypothetical protein [Hexamita inflata]